MMEVPTSKNAKAIYNGLNDNAKPLMSALLQSYSMIFVAIYQMQNLTNQEKEVNNEKRTENDCD